MARTSRIFLSGSVLVIDSLRVSIQFPYHYSNVRKSKKKEKPTRKTGDEGRSVAEAAANEPLGDHFPKVGSYAFLTEKKGKQAALWEARKYPGIRFQLF